MSSYYYSAYPITLRCGVSTQKADGYNSEFDWVVSSYSNEPQVGKLFDYKRDISDKNGQYYVFLNNHEQGACTVGKLYAIYLTTD